MTALTLPADAGTKPGTRSREQAEDRIRMVKNRVQFDLPPRPMERLNALKLKTEASSCAEVVKNALRLSEALIEETERGKHFLDQSGQGAPYRLFL